MIWPRGHMGLEALTSLQRDRATPSRAEGLALRRHRPCGLLLQTRSCRVVSPSTRPIAMLLWLWSNNRVANVQALPCFSCTYLQVV